MYVLLSWLGSDDDIKVPVIEVTKSPEPPNQILDTYENISGEDSLDEIKKNLYSVITNSAGYRTLWCEMPEVHMTYWGLTKWQTFCSDIFKSISYEKTCDFFKWNFIVSYSFGV